MCSHSKTFCALLSLLCVLAESEWLDAFSFSGFSIDIRRKIFAICFQYVIEMF